MPLLELPMSLELEAHGQSRLDERPSAQKLELRRFTDISEAPLLLPLVKAWHAESVYKHLVFSERKCLAGLMTTLGRQQRGAGFYVVWRGKTVGLMELAVGEAWLSEGASYATCLSWYVAQELRQSLLGGRVVAMLFNQGRTWAKDFGAQGLFIHGTHGERPGLLRRGTVIGTNLMVGL